MSWTKGKSRKKTEIGHRIYGKRLVTSGLFEIFGVGVSIYCLLIAHNLYCVLIGIILIAIGIIWATSKVLDAIPHLMYGRRK